MTSTPPTIGAEFAEFDTTEDEFDQAMAQGEPVEIDAPGEPSHGFNERLVVPGWPRLAQTQSSGAVVRNLTIREA